MEKLRRNVIRDTCVAWHVWLAAGAVQLCPQVGCNCDGAAPEFRLFMVFIIFRWAHLTVAPGTATTTALLARLLADPTTRVKSHQAVLTVRKISQKSWRKCRRLCFIHVHNAGTVLRISVERIIRHQYNVSRHPYQYRSISWRIIDFRV